MSETKRTLKKKKADFSSLFASLVSILIGFAVGMILMIICSFFIKNSKLGEGLALLFQGPFSALHPVKELGNMIFYAVPLIFTGLSVGIAYKTGLFNIGAPGQFLCGTMVSLLIALSINSTGNTTKGIFIWIIAILAGMIAGILWGLIPGLLKAFLGINEVIICIMTNWIAANMFTWVFSTRTELINTSSGKSSYLITTAVTGNGTPTFGLTKLFQGSYIDSGIIFAIIIAIALWFLINKTTLGYSMRACGLNKFSAKYAGMNDKLNILISMGLAGGLAALGGCFYYLNPGIEISYKSIYQSLPSYGFDGIPAALLANCNPIAVIFSALFMRYLSASGSNLTSSGFNRYFADIIIATIIYLSGFSRFFANQIPNIQKRMEKGKQRKYMKILTDGLLLDNTSDNSVQKGDRK